MSRFRPHLPQHAVRRLAALTGGAALLVGIALTLSGNMPYLSDWVRVALNPVQKTAAAANTAAAFWYSQIDPDNGYPNKLTFKLYAQSNPSYSCGGITHCSNITECQNPTVGVVSVGKDGVGKAVSVKGNDTLTTFGTASEGVAGGEILVDYACLPYVEEEYYDGSKNNCPFAGDSVRDYASTATVKGPTGAVIYTGANLKGQVTVPLATNFNGGNIILECKRGSDNRTWTATLPVAKSAAVLSISANPANVHYGESSTVTWSATGVQANSCRIEDSGFGFDSINGLEFNANNFTSADQVLDTPTNSYPTGNAILPGAPTYTAGNLSTTGTSQSTYLMSSGKWYWEVTANAVGVVAGVISTGGSATTVSVPAGYTYGFMFDRTAGELYYSPNGEAFVLHATGLTTARYAYATGGAHTMNYGQGGQTGLLYRASSGGLFKYEPTVYSRAFVSSGTFTVPSGYSSLTVEVWGAGGGGGSGGSGNNGGTGTASSFVGTGANLVGNGGFAGYRGASGGTGGAGGSATGGTTNTAGEAGASSGSNRYGGSSSQGGARSSTGTDGNFPGGGGGGGEDSNVNLKGGGGGGGGYSARTFATGALSGSYTVTVGNGGNNGGNGGVGARGEVRIVWSGGPAITGYKALSTANLPVPAIVAPRNYFDTRAFTGTDSGGEQSFTSSGTFTVPAYSTMTVKVWGGGAEGGGGGNGNTGTAGGQSRFNSTTAVVANGGAGGSPNGGAGGAGGTASGGDSGYNLTGGAGAGNTNQDRPGGASPYGGSGGLTGQPATAGGVPGGGGGGGYDSNPASRGGGGGAGGYAQKTFTSGAAGAPVAGQNITVTVGAGGDGADNGGAGARGQVDITWSGGGGQSVTGLYFQPDMIWIKARSLLGSLSNLPGNHWLADSVRGVSVASAPSATAAEKSGGVLSAFLSNGFTTNGWWEVGGYNGGDGVGKAFISWNWLESSASGVDIVTYAGDGDSTTARPTIAHTLGSTPEMVIYKRRNGTSGWLIGAHPALTSTATNYLLLNSNAAEGTASAMQDLTSTTFKPRNTDATNGNNVNGASYVAYLFSQVDGFSLFGPYTGTGLADGPFIWTGFKPRFVMVKAVTGAGDWVMLDAVRSVPNPINKFLSSNLTDAEGTGNDIDFLNNGFKVRSTSADVNASGVRYLYAAFAEMPLQQSAQPDTLTVNSSLRFNGSTAYFSRTPEVTTDRTKWTWSVWLKRANLGVAQTIFSAATDANNVTKIDFNANDTITYQTTRGGIVTGRETSAVALRDPGAWYHLVVAVDTANATAGNRVRFYINGVEIANSVSQITHAIGDLTFVNQTVLHNIGRGYAALPQPFEGYMSQASLVDGAQLGPTSFGGYDANLHWRPKEYTGAYGTNGFHLAFDNTFTSPFLVPNITEPKSFTLACQAPNSMPLQKSVTIGIAPPDIALTSCDNAGANCSNPAVAPGSDANPASYSLVKEGQQARLSWSTAGAAPASCYSVPNTAPTSVNVNQSGATIYRTPSALTASTTYELRCPATWATPPSPYVSSSTRIAVIPATCQDSSSLSCTWRCNADANATQVFTSSRPTLSWCCPANFNDTGATITGPGMSPLARPASGTYQLPAGWSVGTYRVTCNPSGSYRDMPLSVLSSASISLEAVSRIRPGTKPTLRYIVQNIGSNTCTLSGSGVSLTGITNTSASGLTTTGTVNLSSPTTYTLTCSDGIGTISDTAVVNLLPSLREL